MILRPLLRRRAGKCICNNWQCKHRHCCLFLAAVPCWQEFWLCTLSTQQGSMSLCCLPGSSRNLFLDVIISSNHHPDHLKLPLNKFYILYFCKLNKLLYEESSLLMDQIKNTRTTPLVVLDYACWPGCFFPHQNYLCALKW